MESLEGVNGEGSGLAGDLEDLLGGGGGGGSGSGGGDGGVAALPDRKSRYEHISIN